MITRQSGLEETSTKRIATFKPGLKVEVRNLDKSYAGRQILHALNFSLFPGEFVAVVGRSGCGKSTLLRHLAGLELPDSGEVIVDGQRRTDLNANTRVMFQEDRLLPWKTVLQNVGLGMSGDWMPAASAALADVGLSRRAGDWPAVLSGGQKQRVALARALAHAPQFLLLDEPMGALDALTRIEMQRLIERLWLERRFTAMLVTHDVAEAITLADRVILLEQGSVAHAAAVDLQRPRLRGEIAFARLEAEVLEWIMTMHGGFI
ncbi:MAG: ATP-binding cassette domain-containing protein [Candidatus Accumulibacter sp.]|jgi:sulfonate transport system ATP-binding protein|nr:ATP-binding cassette domain-containing protein [Accumulibacter sp.]